MRLSEYVYEVLALAGLFFVAAWLYSMSDQVASSDAWCSNMLLIGGCDYGQLL